MSKEHQNGIMMEHSFLMIDERKTGFQISAKLIQLLAIVIGSWSFISILRECLVIPFNVLQVDLAILIITGVIFSLCLYPSYDLVKLFFAVLFYTLFFISRLPRISNGFFILENLVIDRMTAYYNYTSLYYIADYTLQIQDTTLFVIMMLIPLIAFLAISIIRNRFIHISCLLLFLPISISFLVGLIPSERFLIAYVGIVLYLVRSGFPFRKVANKEQLTLLHRINSRSATWLSLLGLIIFFIMKLFITEDNYEKVTNIKVWKDKVQSFMWNYDLSYFERWFNDITIFSNDTASGGLNGGKLGRVGEIKYENSKQLIVTVPSQSAAEGLYLKGYVGNVYTGDSWDEHTKEEKSKYRKFCDKVSIKELSPVNQNFDFIQKFVENNVGLNREDELAKFFPGYTIYQGNCTVEYKEANKKYMYTPYFTNYDELDKGLYVQDLYMAPKAKKGKYEYNYYFNLSNYMIPSYLFNKAQMGSFTEYEKLYREYVYQVYTNLPEEGLEKLKSEFSKDKLPATTTIDKIFYVRNYLQTKTSYSLSPGKLPEGKDFVEYFLFESKKGYCSHYASAAALILRVMGIPTRYVEGYVIAPGYYKNKSKGSELINSYTESGMSQISTDLSEITVKDNNAHAWVEVYIDGYGWIPMDFTPGSIMNTDYIYNNLVLNDFYEDSANQLMPSYAPITDYPQMNRDIDNMERDMQRGGGSSDRTLLSKVFFVAGFLLIILASSMLVITKIYKRRKLITSNNFNKRVLFLFMDIERILSVSRNGLPSKGARLEECEEYLRERNPYIEGTIFDHCMETARRARFGRDVISRRELREVEAFHRKLYQEVYKDLPIMKKFYLKYKLLMEN